MGDIDYSIYYARFHDDSDAHAELMARMMSRVLEPHLPSDRAARVLDVGCGYGFSLRAMRTFGFADLCGVELSPQQAARCQRAGFNVEVSDDTVGWLEARPAEFDFVILLDVIEHVPVPEQIRFMKAIHTSLRPNGRVVVTTPNANAILAPRWRYNDYTHHCSFTEHSLFFVLRNAGFDRIRIDASKGIGRFPWKFWRRNSRVKLRKWLVRWCWLQVYKAELPWEKIDEIGFELNLTAAADRS